MQRIRFDFVLHYGYNQSMKKYLILLLAFSVFSCSYIPYFGKKTDSTAKKTETTAKADTPAQKDDKGERLDLLDAKPGDIKVLTA